MTPRTLRAHIRPLTEHPPRYTALERAIGVGVGYSGAWYLSQKEHWLGWLREYDGPGAYGRKPDTGRTAAYVYNHIQCAPMLFWLAEALGAPTARIDAAFQTVIDADAKGAPQCAALRKVLPWQDIEMLLAGYPYSLIQLVRIKAANVF